MTHILANTVDIWMLDNQKLSGISYDWRNILSEEELLRADRFHFDKDKNAFVIYHACKRLILADYLKKIPKEISILTQEKGKPFLKDNLLSFNLSHTKNIAVLAVTYNAEIGVDIEYMKKMDNFLDIAKRFFHKKEYQFLQSISNIDEQYDNFYLLWTAKEALLKATGEGISGGLNNFYVTLPAAKNNVLVHSYSKKITLLRLDSPQNHFASLAILGDLRVVCYKNFTLPQLTDKINT